MGGILHTIHVVLAGVWLGGLVFTTAVVSPAFYAEYALLLLLFGLAAAHGAYFGRRLAGLARAEREAGSEEAAGSFGERRRSLQRVSLRISWLNLLTSTVVVVLAVGAQG